MVNLRDRYIKSDISRSEITGPIADTCGATKWTETEDELAATFHAILKPPREPEAGMENPTLNPFERFRLIDVTAPASSFCYIS